MKEFAESLADYRQLAGEPDIKLELTETDSQLVLSHKLHKENLAKIDRNRLRNFLDLFGVAVKCAVSRLVGREELGSLELQPDTVEVLADFIADLADTDDCTLRVAIDKSALAKKAFGAFNGRLLMYFDHARALTVLDGDLVSLERQWFLQNQPVFIVISKPHCLLQGDILNVFGDTPVQTIRELVENYALSDAMKRKLDSRLSTRSRETHWHNGPQFLLPEYLNVSDNGKTPDQTFKPKINQHCMKLMMASLANYTHTENGELVSLFEGQKRFEVKGDTAVAVSNDACRNWFGSYDWIYEDRTSDKLAILRSLVTLQPQGTNTKNYAGILANADHFLRSAKDHYERFVDGSITKYFDKLKDATTYVQSKIDSVGQQVAAIVDTFIKNLLATAGFLVGTILWKIADARTAAAYPVILFAFLAYMAVILLVYYPLIWWSYHLTTSEYDHSLRLYQRSFTTADLEEFIGSAFDRRRRHFWLAFLSTLVMHVLLLAAGIVAHCRGWLR